MTLDDELVATVDEVVKKLKTTRSAFARKALLTYKSNSSQNGKKI
jgi:metal-responsive CopG/Arc/MetJ family transcriptional regulator